jgi:acylphosphatase
MHQEVYAKISGKVQGVGFRSLISRYACKHKIHGFARNLPDGSVEICAQGTKDSIRDFFREIQENSGLALIENFHEMHRECGKKYSSFNTF